MINSHRNNDKSLFGSELMRFNDITTRVAGYPSWESMSHRQMISAYLIPKEQISLAKFKLIQIMLLHETGPHNIQNSKQPASTRVFLVGNRLAFCFNLMGKDMLCFLHNFPRGTGLDGIRSCADILCQQITAVRIKLDAQLVEYVRRQVNCTKRGSRYTFNENSIR